MRRTALVVAFCSALCLSSVSLEAQQTRVVHPKPTKVKRVKVKGRKAKKHSKAKIRRNSTN